VKATTTRRRRATGIATAELGVKALTGPQAAAASMPPMTDEAVAVVARIFAGIERRRAAQATPQAGEVA
jgi:hypothetical protein